VEVPVEVMMQRKLLEELIYNSKKITEENL
jgi:hypothetical protein